MTDYLDALGNPVTPGDHVVLLRPLSRDFLRRVGAVVSCEGGMLTVTGGAGKDRWSTLIKPGDVQLTTSPVYGTSEVTK
jgi:hypothetical protein